MVAAQEKAKKDEAAKHAKKARGKNRGGNSNVGRGKGPAKKGNGDFASKLIDVREEYFPMDHEVYQAMVPFLEVVPDIIPDVADESSGPMGGPPPSPSSHPPPSSPHPSP